MPATTPANGGRPTSRARRARPRKAYYLCANRNKRSVAIDIAGREGQALVRRLLDACDVLVENFKVGDLARYGLGYEQLAPSSRGWSIARSPASARPGPYAPRAGYDYLAQGLGGIMSLTGPADGPPMKVGVGIADLMCGMYAVVGILAALRHRDATGEGQHIDAALLDTQVAWLANEATNYLALRRGAATAGHGASEHRTLQHVRHRRRLRHPGGRQRLAVPEMVRGSPGPPTLRRTRASRPTACG